MKFLATFLLEAFLLSGFLCAQTKDLAWSFAYWNDDFLYEHDVNSLFGRKVLPAFDDYFTTNFSFQTGWGNESVRHTIDAYMNILTSRKEDFRADLVTLRYRRTLIIYPLSLSFSGGIMAIGNLGGEAIQNGYHQLFGHTLVHLPYRFSPSVHAHGTIAPELNIATIHDWQFAVHSGASFTGFSMLNHYNIGSTVSYGRQTEQPFQVQLLVDYHAVGSATGVFRTLLQSGWRGGGYIDYNFWNKMRIGVWAVRGLYGEPKLVHFGLRIMSGSSSTFSMVDLLYP